MSMSMCLHLHALLCDQLQRNLFGCCSREVPGGVLKRSLRLHDSTMSLPDIITPRLELLGCSQLLSHHRLGLVRWFDVDLLFEPFK